MPVGQHVLDVTEGREGDPSPLRLPSPPGQACAEGTPEEGRRPCGLQQLSHAKATSVAPFPAGDLLSLDSPIRCASHVATGFTSPGLEPSFWLEPGRAGPSQTFHHDCGHCAILCANPAGVGTAGQTLPKPGPESTSLMSARRGKPFPNLPLTSWNTSNSLLARRFVA